MPETLKEVLKEYAYLAETIIKFMNTVDIGRDWPFMELYQAAKAHLADPHFQIGDTVIDKDGGRGRVGILYDDGDFGFWPGGNDSAHPNPRKEEP